MEAEKPATGIMKTCDYGDSKCYKVTCACGASDHEIDFEVEAEDTGVNLNVYASTKSDYWSEVIKPNHGIENSWMREFDWNWKYFVNGFLRRVKLTWKIWTEGYVETQVTLIMNQQQSLNLAKTIEKAIEDVDRFREKSNTKTS